MDWEQLREMTLGEVGTVLATEGIGVAGGFLAGGFIGRQVENIVKPGITAESSVTDKIMAWGANNIPKLAIWYLLRNYARVAPGEEVSPMKEMTVDLKKSLAGSFIFDSLMRLGNKGVMPSATFFGYEVLGTGRSPETQKTVQADVQRLIQENSALRAELNKALQRLASQPAIPPQPVTAAPALVAPAPVAQVSIAPIQSQTQVAQQPPVVRYTPIPQQPPAPVPVTRAAQPQGPTDVPERQRRYGFAQYETTPQPIQERERRFGFMQQTGGEKDIAAMFGML